VVDDASASSDDVQGLRVPSDEPSHSGGFFSWLTGGDGGGSGDSGGGDGGGSSGGGDGGGGF
jgi:hypothetical protein